MIEPPSHLDLDALADLLAGEADEAAQRHLQTCASCASRLAELRTAEARVVAVLGALPPPAVPADLDARLAAALTAEAAAGRASVTALPVQPEGPSSGRPGVRSTGRSSWLPAAAAAVLLLSGGGLGYALLQGGGGAESSTAAVAGGQAGPDLVLNNSGTDWSDAAAVRTALPGVLAGRANPITLSLTKQRAEDQAEANAGDTARSTAQGPAGTPGDTSPGSAGGAEAGPDAGAAPAPAAPAPAASAVAKADATPLARLRTAEGLADCLAALLPPEQPEVQPLALDYAQYQGRPALAVVLPDPDPDQLSVFVVGEGCSRADDSTLYFVRVPRP
ncbi:MAG: hypothetical protein WD794_06610 [Mycobacteriales bacterium]